jgi:hypothetical protein
MLVPPHLNDIYMKAKEGRSEPEIKKIASIFDEFKDVFSTDDDDLGTTNIIIQGRTLPFFFRTNTIGLAQGDKDFLIIPCLSICSIVNFSSSAKAKGTRLGGCFNGFEEPVFILSSFVRRRRR